MTRAEPRSLDVIVSIAPSESPGLAGRFGQTSRRNDLTVARSAHRPGAAVPCNGSGVEGAHEDRVEAACAARRGALGHSERHCTRPRGSWGAWERRTAWLIDSPQYRSVDRLNRRRSAGGRACRASRLGFNDVVVKERFDCFRGTSKVGVARKYGVVGVNVYARKPR
jgi:hypothetical protein